jgi:signal transduction histidine kinase
VITTQSFTKDAYTEYHVNLLRNLANYAAIALDNASAYRRLNATLNELQSTQQQLIHVEKMASLGELTAGIAHEIQNPLNFVNNFSEVNSELIEELKAESSRLKANLPNGVDLSEMEQIMQDLEENERKIKHHGQRADAIVKGMLQHSRSSDGQKELTDINALADEYLRLAYHGLRAKDKSFNADFTTDLDEDLPKVRVMPQDIGRVLLNLINNAFQAVSEKAKEGQNGYKPKVTLATNLLSTLPGDADGQRARQAGWTGGAQGMDTGIQITIKDNGPGIPEDIKDKIFQPFFTTKPTGQGTGLGLSLSYDIITKGHNGQLEVGTDEGLGSEFIITLPV